MFPATASQYQPSDGTTTYQIAYSAPRTANTGTATCNLTRPLHARSDSFPIIQTVPAQTEPSPFLPSRGSTIADAGEHIFYDRGRIWFLLSSFSFMPPIPAGDRCAPPVVQYPPTPSYPCSDTQMDTSPRPNGFVAIPSTTVQEDSSSAENMSEPREHVRRMAEGWKEDAKGVLIFVSFVQLILCLLSHLPFFFSKVGIFSATVASFIIESYKMLSPHAGDQISLPLPHPPVSAITVNIMWLMSLVLNIVSALFATLALQWSRRFVSTLGRAVAVTVILLHLSVFLFLVGLVIFFFTIHTIVATVTSVAVGLFVVVYLTLTVLSCNDRSYPYPTPLSDVWRSRRG